MYTVVSVSAHCTVLFDFEIRFPFFSNSQTLLRYGGCITNSVTSSLFLSTPVSLMAASCPDVGNQKYGRNRLVLATSCAHCKKSSKIYQIIGPHIQVVAPHPMYTHCSPLIVQLVSLQNAPDRHSTVSESLIIYGRQTKPTHPFPETFRASQCARIYNCTT
jgi:hypothetical protein